MSDELDTASPRRPPVFSAIDLGTNNCRLLIAVPRGSRFRVVDAYSQIVRLGEGLDRNGCLSEAAMGRTLQVLGDCAQRMEAKAVVASRNVATQACRGASNGSAFLGRVANETGLSFDLVTPEEEAQLAVRGCTDLMAETARYVLVFDIGGGSTELSWLKPKGRRAAPERIAWTSLPIGCVTLAERHPDPAISPETFDRLADEIANHLAAVEVPDDVRAAFKAEEAQVIGTSGTATSLAGVHLGLKTYSRHAVDGLWLSREETNNVSDRLRAMSLEDRALEPCVGSERADLIVPGAIILEGILRAWPAGRIRVGDRGLREGLLLGLIDQWRAGSADAMG